MLEGLYSDFYKLSQLVGPELMCNLKPSDCHRGKIYLCNC